MASPAFAVQQLSVALTRLCSQGMTRAQRYANHKGGRKRDKDGTELPAAHDEEKAECAQIFRAVWEQAKQDPAYLKVVSCSLPCTAAPMCLSSLGSNAATSIPHEGFLSACAVAVIMVIDPVQACL